MRKACSKQALKSIYDSIYVSRNLQELDKENQNQNQESCQNGNWCTWTVISIVDGDVT